MTDHAQVFDQESAENVIQRLADNNDLVDIMLGIEDYFDSNNLYSFKNWIKGEIVSGPYVKKYWVKVTIKYEYKQMPDPSGCMRLLKHGTRMTFRKSTEEVPIEIKTPSDYQPGTKKAKTKTNKIWLIDFLIPRRFVESINKEVLDLYDEELDVDTADQAVAQGDTAEQAALDQGEFM